MLIAQTYVDEFIALRNLEAAVRACGLPAMMASGQEQLDTLASALRAIESARARVRRQQEAGDQNDAPLG